ncbi:MAG: T9SS type A sorting domain-containing protein [Salibacteraceae bacterium]
MGSTVNKILLVLITLVMPFVGHNQSVFNKAFDAGNTGNRTNNAIEVNGSYYFTQKTFKNNDVQLEAVELDSLGNILNKQDIVTNNSYNLFYGYAGSLQYLSNNEFCQLYKVGPDSSLRLVFFDTNLVVIRDVEVYQGYYTSPYTIKQVNDSAIIIIGQVWTSSGDLIVINTDLQGNSRWQTIIGDPNKSDVGVDIEVLNSKILISGNTNDLGPHIYELDDDGTLNFDTIYSNYDFGRNIKYHPNFGLYFLVDNENRGNSQRYPILLKLNLDYTINWEKEYFKNELLTYFQQFTIRDDGVLTFGGGFVENDFRGLFFQVNHNGDSLGSKLIDHIPGERAQFHDIRPTSDGGYIMAGEAHNPGQDSWIVKVNAWGCDNIPCIVSVNENELPKGELTCYPNPANGSGTISGSLTQFTSRTEIKIFNQLGQLVKTIPVTQKDFEVQINLAQSGLYLVNLYQNNELIESKKWVVR